MKSVLKKMALGSAVMIVGLAQAAAASVGVGVDVSTPNVRVQVGSSPPPPPPPSGVEGPPSTIGATGALGYWQPPVQAEHPEREHLLVHLAADLGGLARVADRRLADPRGPAPPA